MPLPIAAVGGALLRAGPAIVTGGQIAGGIKSALPHIDDEVTVTVVGQPGAKRRDLYFLALSAACSVVRRFDAAQKVAPPPGLLLLEYGIGTDAEDHVVAVTLRYKTSLLSSAVAASVASNPAAAAGAIVGGPLAAGIAAAAGEYLAAASKPLPLYSELAVFSGPKDEVIGAPFNFTGYLVPGLPSSSTASGAPKLPFAERTIITKADTVPDPNPILPPGAAALIPSSNPRPPGDNRSRGAVPMTNPSTQAVEQLLVAMVHSVISNPASPYLQTFDPPAAGPNGA